MILSGDIQSNSAGPINSMSEIINYSQNHIEYFKVIYVNARSIIRKYLQIKKNITRAFTIFLNMVQLHR